MKIHLALPKALSAIQNSMIESHRYPDASGYELRKSLAIDLMLT